MRVIPEPGDTPPVSALPQERVTGEDFEVANLDLQRATEPSPNPQQVSRDSFWQRWYAAFKAIWPVYLAVHLAILAISCFAFLFPMQDFSGQVLPVSSLWNQWLQWDAHFYVEIAQQGYSTLQYMAFFPLYPLLIRLVMFAVQSPVIAGLLVSNTAELAMFMILYRLVEKDFGPQRAFYTVLYFALWPSAFFMSGIYTEALFLCLSTLTFYQLRQGRWFLAGICACFASLTRPDGMFLALPFAYEYLSHIWTRKNLSEPTLSIDERIFALIKGIRWDVFCGLLFPGGIMIFMVFGFFHNHDLLAFMHAHKYWSRITAIPGYAMVRSTETILTHGFRSFTTMRSLLELGCACFVLLMIILIFVGPWRFSPGLWGYGLYAILLFLYFQTFPVAGLMPLESIERFLLEIFPAFILLSGFHKYRSFNLSYCMVAGALLFFMLAQYLNHHWIT